MVPNAVPERLDAPPANRLAITVKAGRNKGFWRRPVSCRLTAAIPILRSSSLCAPSLLHTGTGPVPLGGITYNSKRDLLLDIEWIGGSLHSIHCRSHPCCCTKAYTGRVTLLRSDPGPRTCNRRYARRTCNWLLETPRYTQWIAPDISHWCHGPLSGQRPCR